VWRYSPSCIGGGAAAEHKEPAEVICMQWLMARRNLQQSQCIPSARAAREVFSPSLAAAVTRQGYLIFSCWYCTFLKCSSDCRNRGLNVTSCSQSKYACLCRSHEALCFANRHGIHWPNASLPLCERPMPACSWVCQLFDARS